MDSRGVSRTKGDKIDCDISKLRSCSSVFIPYGKQIEIPLTPDHTRSATIISYKNNQYLSEV